MDFKPESDRDNETNFQPNNQPQPITPVPDVNASGSTANPTAPVAAEPAPYQALEAEPATTGQAPVQFGTSEPQGAPTSQPVVTTSSELPAMNPFEPTNQPAPFAAPPAPKSKKKKLFVISAVVLLLAGIGSGVYASYRLYQSPESVMMGAVSQLLNADHIQAATVLSTDQVSEIDGMSITIKKITLNSKTDYTPANENDAQIELAVDGKTYNFGGSVMTVASGDAYFKVSGVMSTIEQLAQDMGQSAGGAELDVTLLKELEGKWVKISLADIKEFSPEFADTYKCTLDVYKQYGSDKAMTDEVISAYKANQFVQFKGEAKYKEGMIGYDVELDKQKLKDFSKAFEATAIYKKVAECDKTDTVPSENESDEGSVSETIDEVANEYSAVNTLWFDQWGHQLKQLDSAVKYTPKDAKAISTNLNTKMSYDETVKIEAPKDAMSFKDFQQKVTAGYQQMMNSAAAEQ